MKKSKKIIKTSKLKKIKLQPGIGRSYNKKKLTLFGLKPIKNNFFLSSGIGYLKNTNPELVLISDLQSKKFKEFENYNLKMHTLQLSNKTYKGSRIKNKLPLRGQRTHTNAQTSRKLNKEKNA